MTDTDMGFPLKAAMSRCKDEMKREMRTIAEKFAQVANFKRTPLEEIKIAHAGHVHLEELNSKQNLVVAGLRRNGLLSWRPDVEKKSFVRADSQPWCKDLAEGSHRYPKSWLADRYSWLSEDGVPCEADWKSCGKRVKTHKDMEDATAHGEEGAVVKMSCWADVPELKECRC